MSGFVGVTALLTGGASGTALAAAILLATRGARLACLNLAPELLPEPGYGSPVDATSVRAAVAPVASRRWKATPARTR